MSTFASLRRARLASLLCGTVLVGWSGVACVPEQPRAEDPAMTRALELLETLRSDYPSWPRLEPWSGRERGSGSHGRAIELFVSPEAAAVLEGGQVRTAWPTGSRFVVEGFEDEDANETFVLSIMQKVNGTWRWAQYEDDVPVAFGRPTSCIGCHLAGDDLVRSFSLPHE